MEIPRVGETSRRRGIELKGHRSLPRRDRTNNIEPRHKGSSWEAAKWNLDLLLDSGSCRQGRSRNDEGFKKFLLLLGGEGKRRSRKMT